MFEKILTPTTLWKSFELPDSVGANLLEEQNIDGTIFSKLIIEGRTLKDGKVSIYAELMRNASKEKCPAILLLEDFSISKKSKLAKDLLSKGYSVLTVDLEGYLEGKEHYTEYPQSISYANYDSVKDNIYAIKKDAKATCWYEWCAVLKYAVKYLKGLPYVSKVGAFGISTVATALWQMVGSDQSLDANVIALNSGWIGYKDIYKFGDMVEPQFTSEMCQFIAGIDSQSYAMHIKTPTLLLNATNDSAFDVDRAQDTMSKIPEETYEATYISINNTDRINNSAYNNALLFFDKFLRDAKIDLPKQSEIKCELDSGTIIIDVKTDTECKAKIDKVEIYVAEEMINPTLRCWQKLEVKKGQDGVYLSEYSPYKEGEIVFAFAIVEYKNGFKSSTNLIAKRFTAVQVNNTFKSNILYSSRLLNSHSIFTPATPSNLTAKKVDVVDRGVVREKKGPMGITGVTCSGGLLTFALASKKYQPKDGSIFMLDAYLKEQSTLTVKLISDYFANKTEYFVKVNLLGGDVWHNAKIEMNKFKTAEGMALKDYSKINALEISVDKGEFLINNLLWL